MYEEWIASVTFFIVRKNIEKKNIFVLIFFLAYAKEVSRLPFFTETEFYNRRNSIKKRKIT